MSFHPSTCPTETSGRGRPEQKRPDRWPACRWLERCPEIRGEAGTHVRPRPSPPVSLWCLVVHIGNLRDTSSPGPICREELDQVKGESGDAAAVIFRKTAEDRERPGKPRLYLRVERSQIPHLDAPLSCLLPVRQMKLLSSHVWTQWDNRLDSFSVSRWAGESGREESRGRGKQKRGRGQQGWGGANRDGAWLPETGRG